MSWSSSRGTTIIERIVLDSEFLLGVCRCVGQPGGIRSDYALSGESGVHSVHLP